MIYTSYYYQLQQHRFKQFINPSTNTYLPLIVVSNTVSRFISREAREKLIAGYQNITKPDKVLTKNFRDNIITEKEYTEAYIRILNQRLITHEKLFLELITLAQQQDIVLFCYEKKGQFCHRHILARWLIKQADKHGIIITAREWNKK